MSGDIKIAWDLDLMEGDFNFIGNKIFSAPPAVGNLIANGDFSQLSQHTDWYISNFIIDEDNWKSYVYPPVTGTLSAPVTIAGEDNWLEYTCNDVNGAHFAYKQLGSTTYGRLYKISFRYYIPVGQSNIDGIRYNSGGSDFSVLGVATDAEYWFYGGNVLKFYASDGGVITFQDLGGNDKFYLKNIVVDEYSIFDWDIDGKRFYPSFDPITGPEYKLSLYTFWDAEVYKSVSLIKNAVYNLSFVLSELGVGESAHILFTDINDNPITPHSTYVAYENGTHEINNFVCPVDAYGLKIKFEYVVPVSFFILDDFSLELVHLGRQEISDTNDLSTDEGLETAVIISLFSDRRANEDDILPDVNNIDLRGWWGDLARPEVEGDQIGSRLWLLSREKTEEIVLAKAKIYAEEALKWMLDDGVAVKINITVDRIGIVGNDILALLVEIYQQYDNVKTFKYELQWKSQSSY